MAKDCGVYEGKAGAARLATPAEDRVVYEDDRLAMLVRQKAAPPLPPAALSPLHDLVNRHRTGMALDPLARDVNAEAIAQGWADTMATTEDFRHNPNVSRDLADPWFANGENIAWGYATEAIVHQAWLDSAPHRRNVEDGRYTALGIGKARGAGGLLYWVEVFVDRKP